MGREKTVEARITVLRRLRNKALVPNDHQVVVDTAGDPPMSTSLSIMCYPLEHQQRRSSYACSSKNTQPHHVFSREVEMDVEVVMWDTYRPPEVKN